jgi:hypothetical protein
MSSWLNGLVDGKKEDVYKVKVGTALAWFSSFVFGSGGIVIGLQFAHMNVLYHMRSNYN